MVDSQKRRHRQTPQSTTGARRLSRRMPNKSFYTHSITTAPCHHHFGQMTIFPHAGAREDYHHEKEADRIADITLGQNFTSLLAYQKEPLSSVNHLTEGAQGASLSPGARTFFDARLGHSFSDVRIHTGDGSDRLTQLFCADAVTIGEHVFFAQDQYHPSTLGGARLLAHELTHVVQQSNNSKAILQRKEKKGKAKSAPTLVVVDNGASPAAKAAGEAYLNRTIGSLKPDNMAKLSGLTIEMHIIPHNKKLTDLPHFTHLQGTKTFDGRLWDNVRGCGGIRQGNVIRYAVAEEKLAPIPGRGMTGGIVGGIMGGILGGIVGFGLGGLIGLAFSSPTAVIAGAIIGGIVGLIGGAIGGAFIGADIGSKPLQPYGFMASHESGHVVETFALTRKQRQTLNDLYKKRKKAGGPWLNPKEYTSANADEYFAQSSAAYFERPFSDSKKDKEAYTKKWLQTNDPEMYKLLKTIYK